MPVKIKYKDPRFIAILFGIAGILVRIFYGIFPGVCESVYSRGIFPVTRSFLDYTLGLLPFPGVYALLGLISACGAWRIVKMILRKEKIGPMSFGSRFGEWAYSFAAVISAGIFLFMFLWGWNYARIPVEKTMKLPKVSIDLEDLLREIEWTEDFGVNARRNIAGDDSFAILEKTPPEDLERVVRKSLQQVLASNGFPASGKPRVRSLSPKGLLLRLGISGIYLPFTGEGHIDASLPAASVPFTMAHEMSHAYGFGNEGVANFLAFLACTEARENILQYSGAFAYWRYLMGELKRRDPEMFKAQKKNTPKCFLKDLEAIRENNKQYPTFFPDLSDKVNDTYLKSQGVKDGVESYGTFVRLAIRWRRK